MKFSFKNMKQM